MDNNKDCRVGQLTRVKAEGDVVASTKEAEQAGQPLIKERETLA